MHISKEVKTFNDVSTEILVVGVQKHPENSQNWSSFVSIYGENIDAWVGSGDIVTDVKKLTKLPLITGKSNVKRILFVGLGDSKKLDEDTLREAFGLVGKELKSQKVSDYTIWLDSFVTDTIEVTDVAFLAAEGIGLGFYTVENYKTTSNEVNTYLESIYFITTADMDEVVASYEVGNVYAQAVNEARNLVNLPPNLLTATALAEYAVKLANQYDFDVEILDKAQMEELGMGAILSSQPRIT